MDSLLSELEAFEEGSESLFRSDANGAQRVDSSWADAVRGGNTFRTRRAEEGGASAWVSEQYPAGSRSDDDGSGIRVEGDSLVLSLRHLLQNSTTLPVAPVVSQDPDQDLNLEPRRSRQW